MVTYGNFPNGSRPSMITTASMPSIRGARRDFARKLNGRWTAALEGEMRSLEKNGFKA